MKCHDGSRGNHIQLRRAGSEKTFDQYMRTTNHPIGMRYSTAYTENPRDYVSPATIRPEVKIIDGKVGCLSCHQKKTVLLASTTNELALDEECTNNKEADALVSELQLCLSCHIK